MINAVNEQFSRFVNFAEDQRAKGANKAIATMGDVAAKGDTPLEERNIKITDKSDWVGKVFFRKDDAKAANNEVRELFKKTIIDMFGGEKNIPDSVKEAMLMKDYGCGKPLTARRIMAEKDAIDAEDSMREKEVSPHDFRRDVRRGGSCHRLRQGHRRQGHGSAATSIQSSSRAFTTRFRRAASAATSTAASSHTASRPTSTWPSRSPSSSLTAIDGAGQDCLGRDCPNMV